MLLADGGRHAIEAGYAIDWLRERHRTTYDYLAFFDSAYSPERRAESESTTYSAYLQDDVLLTSDLRVRLGLRAEASGTYRSFQPRLAARYRLSDRLDLTAAAGTLRQYVHVLQDPDVDLLSVYSVDIWLSAHEPGVTAGRATHLVGGIEARLPYGLAFRAEAYQKRYDGLVAIAPYDPAYRIPAILRLDDASGLARGLDVSLGREGAEDVRGWIGYSLAASERTVDGAAFPADPHPRQRIVAVLDARRNDRWRLTGRLEAREGVPYTPAVAMLPRRIRRLRTAALRRGVQHDGCPIPLRRAERGTDGLEQATRCRRSLSPGRPAWLDLGCFVLDPQPAVRSGGCLPPVERRVRRSL